MYMRLVSILDIVQMCNELMYMLDNRVMHCTR